MFVTGNGYSRTNLEKTTQECRNNVTKSIQKMIKNRIKISALLITIDTKTWTKIELRVS